MNLSVQIGKLKLQNPVSVASGTFGYGVEYAQLLDLNQLGAVVVKGIRLGPVRGNPTPRTVEVVLGEPFVAFQARAFGMGGPKERRFTLAADAPPLPSDAPGSASLRVGAALERQDPLDSWLSLLFGP